jgi:hypothetical protein
MTKPPDLIDLEQSLDAAERAEREAFELIMPPGVTRGHVVVTHTPADDDMQRWMAARQLRDDLRAQHRALIDRLFGG